MRKFILIAIVFLALIAAVVGGLSGKFLAQYAGGKELWLAWKAERIAAGDRFAWSQLVPPDVPDDQNFAKAPLVAGAILGKDSMDPRFQALKLPELKGAWGDWKEGRRVDLKAYGKAYGSKNLLGALQPHESALKELEEASLRPHSRLPVDYAESEVPAILGFRSATRLLCVRALAQLEKGNSDAALSDVNTCLRIAEHLRSEPCILAGLLRSSLIGNAMQVVWEGLASHRWNERQLGILQDELSRIDLLASWRLAWEGERLMCLEGFIRTAEGLPQPRGFQDPKEPQAPVRLGAFGKGWYYRNVLEMDRFFVTTALEVIDPKAHRVYPERYVSPSEWLERRSHRKDLFMALMAVPTLVGQHERQAMLQSCLDQAAVVCALERHRLATGEYPSELRDLSPVFMSDPPRDIATGRPLHYVRRKDRFRLYSVGWDQKDDGGTPAWRVEQGKQVRDASKGDWAWRSGG